MPRSAMIVGIAAALLSIAPTAYAERPNILVMPGKIDPDMTPSGHFLLSRIGTVLNDEINSANVAVVDQTAASVELGLPDLKQRSDAELITIARAISHPPLDAIVIYNLHYSAKPGRSGMRRPELRISSRILDVPLGRFLGMAERTGQDLPLLPRICDVDCENEHIGEHAQLLARTLGRDLSEKLTTVTRSLDVECDGISHAFVTTFDGFTSQDISRLEELMRGFKCFEGMQPVSVRLTHAEYSYETRSGAALLNRRLRVMFEDMNLSAQIQLSGNLVRVTNIGTR